MQREQAELDSQQIELIGRAVLTSALVRQGFEVALPQRDHEGIDLMVYSTESLRVLPLQMKASTGTRFVMDRKYERFKQLVFAHVWKVRATPQIYLMTHDEILDALSKSIRGSVWKSSQKYTFSHASNRLKEALQPYQFGERCNWLRGRLRAR